MKVLNDWFLIDGFLDLGIELKNVDALVQMHLYETGSHGYGLRKGNPAAEKWPELFHLWVQKVLKNIENE